MNRREHGGKEQMALEVWRILGGYATDAGGKQPPGLALRRSETARSAPHFVATIGVSLGLHLRPAGTLNLPPWARLPEALPP